MAAAAATTSEVQAGSGRGANGGNRLFPPVRASKAAKPPRASGDLEATEHRALVGRAVELVRALPEQDGHGLRAHERNRRDRTVHSGALDLEVVDIGLVRDHERVLA